MERVNEFKDGWAYEGVWKDDKQHGQGTMTSGRGEGRSSPLNIRRLKEEQNGKGNTLVMVMV